MSTEDEKLLKEAKKLPWEDRLTHKNWKVRNDANIDLAAMCDSITDPKDPRLREVGHFFKKAVSDSNAPVQEKALDALIAFLKAADADVGRFAKETCDAVVAKCLTGRPKTVEKAQMVFLLWIELEASEVFLDAMEKAIKNKVAKAVVPAIDVMYMAVSEFGTKVVPAKKILKMLPDLFDHQDQHVRASAKGLTLELCRWIGKDPVKSILFEKMRDTMKKELENELATVTGFSKPTRKIRSEQDKEVEEEVAAETTGAGPAEEEAESGPQEVDEYELVDPVDILAPLEKSGFWDKVKATKWSDRKEGVSELVKLASTKRIAPGDFSEVCRTLKKLVTDVNIAVATESVQAIGHLARGLRKDFTAGSRMLLPVLLEKLKEKKPVMAEALTQSLQAMHKSGCVSLLDVTEEVKGASKNKVPQVRSLTLNWVAHCVETSNKATVLKIHKEYVPICMESLNDGTPEVRDAAFSILAAIAKLVGMRPLERSLEKLDEVRKKKLTEMIGTSGNGQGPAVQATGPTRSGAGQTSGGIDNVVIKKSAASLLSGKRPALQTQPAKKTAPKAGATKKDGNTQSKASVAVESNEDIEPGEMSIEEIEERVGSLVPADVLTNLKSAAWKERLEAITTLKETVESLTNLDQNAEILIRLLSTLPGWGEKNVQVQQKVIEIVTYISSTASKFPKRCIVLCILGVSERVSDIKTRGQAIKCLTAFSEAVGPNFVFERLFKIMKDHKNPKVLSEGLLWMGTAVEDFGVSHIKLKEVIDFCKDVGLQSSNAATRNSTIKLIGILHKFVGPDIKGFLSDVKPALLSALDTEYEKNPYEGPTIAPKKTIKGLDSASGPSGSISDSLPREDISAKLTPELYKNLSSSDWKARLESLESISKILEEANKRIQPAGTGELFGALKARLYDTNKNLITTALTTIANVASAMGAAVDKNSKGILSDVLKCLGDNKKQTRETTIKTLDSWVAAAHLDKMVPYICTTLSEVKLGADGRKDLFEWLARQLTQANDQPDMIQLLKPTSSALLDKSVDVRKSAEHVLAEIIRVSGQEVFAKGLRELQGQALNAVLERHRSAEISDPVRASTIGVGTKPASKSVKSNANAGERPPSRSGVRPAGTRGILPKGTKQSAVVVAQDLAVQGQVLFNITDSNKEQRERHFSRKHKFEDPRPEHIQELENDLMKYFREDLHRRLLSPDFKKQVDGLEILQKAIPTHGKEMVEMVDILLRWTVLRLCESNTTCLLKVLEFLPVLFEAFKNDGYMLTESEANIFLPFLVEKLGHNIEKVREKLRELTKLTACVYPSSKLFAFVLEGLKSKNNRTRIEAVDLLGYMIDLYGIEICGPTKALQAVAALTSERDGEIRKAALNTLATSYKILGDDIWRFVGKLTDAQKSMIDDKFKWKAREMEKRKEGRPGEARAAMRRSVRDNGQGAAEQSVEGLNNIPTQALQSVRASTAGFSAPVVQLSAQVPAPCDWNEALEVIARGSAEQAVEGMKFVCYELSQVVGDNENSSLDGLVRDSNHLVTSLSEKVPQTFNLSLNGASSRACKYVLNTLMQTFQIKKLAYAVNEGILHTLITELLLWLLDERVPMMDDGSQLLKALNVLMLKILENAERTSAFVVLINLLRPLDPSMWHFPAYGEAAVSRNQKFSDLVVKCLIKLTKVLPNTIFEVDLDRLLQSIHVFLQDLGLDEIRRRAGADDKPLRMVKTVLHELVKIRGTAIKGHLSMVPIDVEPQPIILAYIDLNLQTLAAARMLAPSGTGQAQWGDSGANSAPTQQSTEAQLKQELAAIFKKIGDRDTCTIGLYELYRITQLYPQVDIFSQLQNASEAFRIYIRDGLAQMAKNAAAGRTPSSVPISTPPPVSSALSSPKVGPPSPINTKLQSVRADNTMPNIQSVHESNDASGGTMPSTMDTIESRKPSQVRSREDQDENCIVRGEVTRVTLDAIRERMKSIQAAAAAGSIESVPFMPYSNVPNPSFSRQENMSTVNPPMDDKALSGLQARMERLKLGNLEPV